MSKKPRVFHKVYSSKTGRMTRHLVDGERMSTAELAAHLTRFANAGDTSKRCPHCGGNKAMKFLLCLSCYLRKRKLERELGLEVGKRRNESFRKKAQPPAKNQARGRFVNKLMNPYEVRTQVVTPQAQKPKTILRKKSE